MKLAFSGESEQEENNLLVISVSVTVERFYTRTRSREGTSVPRDRVDMPSLYQSGIIKYLD